MPRPTTGTRLLSLLLCGAGAVLALRENSLDVSLERIGGRLRLEAHGAGVDLGVIPEGSGLALTNVGPGARRSPVCLLRRAGPVFEPLDLLLACRHDAAGRQEPLVLEAAELQQGPVRLRLWNPFHPGIELGIPGGARLALVRFHVPERRLTVEVDGREREQELPSPFGRLVLAGLAFAALSAASLVCLVRLLWSFGGRSVRVEEHARGGWAPCALAFAAGALSVGYVHFAVYRQQPGFGDELNYLVQARILASGHLSLPEPRDAEFFTVDWMDLMGRDGRMWDFHPIGHSALLALGFLLGSPSLVTVLVGGGVFAALFALARRLSGSAGLAWLTVLTAASSQFLVTLAASFMAHASALLFIELSMLALLAYLRHGRQRTLVLAGAFLGAAFLVRPISAVLLALVPLAVLAFAPRRKLPLRALCLAALAAASIASLEPLRTYLTAGRFTLGYLAKGPEIGGLTQVLSQPWEWRLQNLYLNYRYYHDRVFGLGFGGNLLFFFVPLLAGARQAWVRLSYLAILLYWVVHSFLHFYGWKWEPRMLLEVTHLTILLTAYGLWLVVTGCRPGAPESRRVLTPLLGCLVAGFLAWNLGYDIPERLRNEYAGYNSTDPTIREEIRARPIRNAVFLYDDPTLGFAPHLPENEIRVGKDGGVTLEGDVIHAIHLGPAKDHALLSRYPERRVFRVRGPRTLEEAPSLYSEVVPRLARLIGRHRGSRPAAVGVPWLRYVDRRLLEPLSADLFFDDEAFFRAFGEPTRPPGTELVVCLGALKGHSRALLEMFEGAREVAAEEVGIPVSLTWIDPARRRAKGPQPGLRFEIIRGVRCGGERVESRIAGTVDLDATGMQDVCAEWSGEFRLVEPATYTFATTSDDGSGLAIDGRRVLDNAMYESQGRTRREGSVELGAGAHRLKLTYSQFTGPAWIEAEVRKGAGAFAPLSLASFDGLLHADDPGHDAPSPAVAETPRAVPPKPRGPIGPRVDPALLRLSSFRTDAPDLPAQAKDGRPETRWDTGRPQAGGEWLRIDLLRPVRVTRMAVDTAASPQDYPRRLQVLVSANGIEFRPAALVEGGSPETDVRLDLEAPACSLRLEQHGSDPVYFWSVHELTLWGQPARGSCAASTASEPPRKPSPKPAEPEPRPPPPQTLLPDAPRVDPRELRVSSSRVGDPDLAKMAVDGLPGTRWDTGRPQVGGEWFRVDLPGAGELHGIRLETDASPEDYPRELHVSVSEDGARFEPATSLRGSGPVTELRFDPPLRCRAVRLDQTGQDPRFWWSIQELTVLGRFPPRPRGWLDAIPHPKAWLALLLVLGAGGGALLAGRARGLSPPPEVDAPAVARRFAIAGAFVLLATAATLLATQSHYGETWDEFEHFANGEEHYQYLFGSGETPPLFGHHFRKFYGPFSDTLAAILRHALHERLGWMSAEGAVHLHLLLLFVLAGGVLFSTVRREHGGRAALLCLAAFLTSPHLLGHCHNNMKDFAVTAWMVIAVFTFHSALRRGSYPGLALAGLVTGMALATKINGLLLAPILLGYTVLSVLAGERSPDRIRFAALGGVVVHWTMALASMVLFWPWLWDAPFSRLLRGVRFFQDLWLGPVLYQGRIFNAKDLPWDYTIVHVLITTPLLLLPFAAAGMSRALPAWRRGRPLPALVLLAFLVVIGVATLAPVPRYDGVRHFLPAFPFLACLAGFGLDFALDLAKTRTARRAAALLVVGVLGSVVVQDLRLHPYQGTYFNLLVGGGRGAMGRFELDYWGSSLKEAGRYVNRHAPPGSRVHVVLDLERLAKLRPDLTPTATDPDYAIVLARESLAANPYRDRRPDYVVEADGAVLARVYRLVPR